MANSISYGAAFFKILTQPKETLRALVDNDPGYGKWVLIPVYAFLAGFNADFYMMLRQYLSSPVAILTEIFLMMMVGITFYWIGSFLVFLFGKWLGGTGTLKDVSTAYAWAYVPCCAALLLAQVGQIPKWMVIFSGTTDLATVMAAGRWLTLLAGLANFAFFAWSWVLIAFGVSEAHRISLGRGFGAVGFFFGVMLLFGILIGVLVVVFYLGRIGGV